MAARYRKISRYNEIIRIMMRHGYRYLVDCSERRKAANNKKKKYISEQNCQAPQRVRMLFEDLGPTFVKMGQLLSARPDLVPPEYVEEFKKLQDHVEEFCEEDVRNQFLKEFGKKPEEIYHYFDYSPLASASIGQVHEAELPEGQKVVVKVQRPNLNQLIRGDIKILKRFSGLLQNRTLVGKVCNVSEIIEVFERQITKELDYLTEAVNTEFFFREYQENPDITVPRVYSDYTTGTILTMDFVGGFRMEEFDDQQIGQDDRLIYAQNMLLAVFRPLFEKGVFHGDPHPGNVLFQNDYKIVLIDFGIVGRFDRKFRRLVAELMIALTERDVSAVMNIILETGIKTKTVHQQYFYEDVSEIVERANGVTSGGMNLGQLLNGMITISINHGIKMPDNLFILGKTVMISENMARKICSELDIAQVLKPVAVDFLKNNLHSGINNGNLYRQISNVTEAITTLPKDLCQAVRNFANNETRITFYHRNLNWLYDMIDISSSRVSFGLILAALIVGSAVIMHTGKGPLLWGYPVLGTVGFIFSSVFGVLVLLSMLRTGRIR